LMESSKLIGTSSTLPIYTVTTRVLHDVGFSEPFEDSLLLR